jgi:crotonobetainyl-CoA hydratase
VSAAADAVTSGASGASRDESYAAAEPVVDEVRFEVVDHVAWVTIDRPAVLNAVDKRTHDRLQEIWGQIEKDPDVRVVVLTGAGDRAFCVGADMSATAIEKTGLEYWADLDPDGFGGLSLRTTLDVPVIARVNGYAMGGGMEMVLGCDIVIAADTAKFALSEPRVGRLPLDGGIPQLVRRIPHTQAMGLLLTGRRASAAELQQMGLVNEVVPAAALDEAVDRWVQDVLACAPPSLRAIKQMVQQTAHLTAREARAQRLPALMAALDSEDSREGVRAFQEKRPPVWTGR